MDGNPRKCLVRWHEYSDSVTVAVQTLRYDEELLDVTLACEGQTIRAHKLVLAASSQYFRQVLKDFPCEHPTIVIDGVRWRDLLALLQFMYYGQVLVEEEAVLPLLTAASSLAVVGLSYITAALTHTKLTPKDNSQADDDDASKGKESSEQDASAEREPQALGAPLNPGSNREDQIPEKDTPSLNASSKEAPTATNSSSFLHSLSLLKPNIPSIVTTKKTDSVEAPTQTPSRKPADEEVSSPNQPHSKRLKMACENEPPDSKGRLYRLDHFREESARRACHENAVSDPHRASAGCAFVDKEEARRGHVHEKVLSERKLNAENVCGDSGMPSEHPILNGDNLPVSKAFEDRDYLDSELSQESASPESGDPDLGPAPLPLNHPAVLAASSSVAAAAAVSYAALLAANTRGVPTPTGMGNGSPLHSSAPSPSGISLPVWMPPTSNASPSPSPPAQGFVHPPGMSQQDLQATLEQYQRKLAFHEPRPCPTCKRMYRDAATLRTHIAIMHSEGKEPFGCTCGALFRTKYDMYQHKKNGHR